jgi:hypothetical protein
MLQRWHREFVEFFFTKGSALTVAIAFIVGQHSQEASIQSPKTC